MKIIDAHAHIFEHLAGFGRRGEIRAIGEGRIQWATGEEAQIIPPELGDKEFTPEALLSVLDAYHVAQAVLHEYVKEAVTKYPERFAGAGIVDPYCLNVSEILHHLVDDLAYRILKFEFSSGAGLMGYHPRFTIDGPEKEKYCHETTITGKSRDCDRRRARDWKSCGVTIGARRR